MFLNKTGSDNPAFTDTRFLSCTDLNNGTAIGLPYNESVSPYTSGLISGYKLDNNDFSDVTGVNNGTNFGSTNTSGKILDGRDFDGIDDYISVPLDLTSLSEFSESLWFKMDAEGYITSFTHSSDDDIRLTVVSGDLYFVMDDGTQSLTITSFTDTTSWHHVVGTHTNSGGGLTSLYLDGVLKDTATGTFDFAGMSGNDYLGDRATGSGNNWNGKIDEVMLFNRSLNQTEVLELYNEQKSQLEFNHTLEAMFDGQALAYNSSISPYTSELLAGYKLDNNDFSDVTGVNNGTNTGSTNTSGKILSARDFSATSDRIDLGSSIITSTTSFSVSIWANMDDITNDGMLIGNGDNTNGFYLYHISSTQFNARFGGVNHFHGSNPGFSNGVWSHVVATFDGSTYKLYIDGELKQSESATGVAADDNMKIGNWYNNDLAFVGKLDEVMIFNRSLSQTEIFELYNGTKGQFRLNNLGENCSLRYYGNSEATSTSSASDVYFEPVSAYYLDANANDFVGSNHGTVSGATLSSGYINGSYNFTLNSNDQINFGFTPDLDILDGNFSINIWVKPHSTTANLVNIMKQRRNIFYDIGSDGDWGTNICGVGLDSTSATITTNWQMLTISYDEVSNNLILYADGTQVATTTTTTCDETTDDWRIGIETIGSNNAYGGKIDELLFYDYELTPDQIYKLYTQTAPNFVEGAEQNQTPADNPPVIVLNSPVNNSVESSQYVIFNTTVTDDEKVQNVSLIIDGVLNQTNSSNFNGTYIFNVSIPESNHNWSILAYDNASQSTQSETRFFVSDFFDPTISIIFPVNNTNYGYNVTTLNTTASDTHLEACWYSLDNFTTNTTFTCNTNVTGLLANQGTNYWRACANDSAGKESCNLSVFTVDSIDPNVTIIYPVNGTYYNSTVTQLNYSVNDSNSDSCWYSIDGGVTNSSSVSAGVNFSVNSSEGKNNWTVYCNDTFSNVGSDEVTFYHDTTSPNITINKPDDIEEVNWNESLITYNVTSNELLPLCIASLDSFTTNHSLNTSDNLTFYGNISTNNGNNVVNYYCEDYAGNTNYTSKSFEVRRNLIVDNVTISLGGNLEYYKINVTSTGAININGTGYLNLTGISSIDVQGQINSIATSTNTTGAGGDGSASGCAGGAASGGGGAGHNNAGGSGGDITDPCSHNGGTGGSSYPSTDKDVLNVGSIGGRGPLWRGSITDYTDGGNGGGSLKLKSTNINLSGADINLYAGNGENGDAPSSFNYMGGGGGGSGGTLTIEGYNVYLGDASMDAHGGNGGDGDVNPGACTFPSGAGSASGGGGGAGGIIKVFYDRTLEDSNISNVLTGGTGGTGADAGVCGGTAVNGNNGGVGQYYTEEISFFDVKLHNPIENTYNKNPILFNCSTFVSGYDNLTLIIDGVDNLTVNGSGSFNLTTYLNLSDGLHNYTCRAEGNTTNQPPVFNFYADTSAPIIEQLSPVDNFITENVSNNFTVNLTDNLSGLKNASLYTGFASTWTPKSTNSSLNNASNLNITFNTSILPETIWSIRFCDAVGNCNWTTNRTIFLDTYDPIITILYPANTSYIINVSEINYTVFDNYPDSCWYSMDNGVTNSSSVSSGTNFTGVISSIGANTATVYCNDSRGNVGNKSVTYTLDAIRYSSDSDPTNTSVSGVGDVFINVTINPIVERQNISFRGYNLTNGSITQYLSNDFTNSTNFTNLTSTSNPFYWNVILYDTNNVSYTLATRYKGFENVNLSLNGTFGNIIAELGSDILVNATSNISYVYIDVDHPSYGVNYSSAFLATGFELVINWFRTNVFANSLMYQIANFTAGFGVDENKTFNLTAHQYDEIINISVNITGTNNPQGVAFYKANSTEYDRVFFGNLTSSGYIQQDKLLDRSTTPNNYTTSQTISFDNQGTAFTYFLLDDAAKLINFILDVVSVEYGFTFTDNFSTDDYMDSVLTTTIKKLNVVVPDGTNLREILIDDFEDAFINTSLWILVANIDFDYFTYTLTTAESNGYLQIGVFGTEDLPGAAGEDIDADFTSNQYIYLSGNDSYIYSVDKYKVDFTFYLEGEESSASTTSDCYNKVTALTNNIEVFSLDLPDGDDGRTRKAFSDTNMSLLISWYNSSHYSVLVNGTDKQTGYDYNCGNFQYTRYWNNGQRNFTSASCPTTSTSLQNPFYITQDTFTWTNGLTFNVNNNHDADLLTGLTDICLGDGYYCSSLTSPCTGTELNCRNFDGTDESSCETGPPWHIGTCTWYDTISNVLEGCNNFDSYFRVLNVNRSIKTPIDSSYYSSSVFDSSIPINTITMQESFFSANSELFNFISTDDGDNYQNIILNQSTPITNPGEHVKFRTDFEINESLGWYPNWPLLVDVEITSTPSNLSNLTFDFGNDGIIDYTINGEVSIANGTLEVDLSSADISGAFTDTPIAGQTHIVPLVIGSSSAGAITLSGINLTYNSNPVYLNSSSIQTYLNNYGNGETTIPMIIEGSGNNSIVNITDLRFDYAGGNDTIEVTAHNADYTKNLSRNITYYYSRWDYEWKPDNVEWIYFAPTKPTSQNVTPYGQTSTVPIINITNYGYGGLNATLSILQNDTLGCVNTTISLDNNKSNGYLLTGNWTELTNLTYLEATDIYLWADYNCNYSTWRMFEPSYYFRQCVNGGVCSIDLI
jgi:hypothetical protein